MVKSKILLVTFPGQGHINPSLQLAKRHVKLVDVKVTFLTSQSAIRRMTKTSTTFDAPIDFVSFDDGYDNGWSNDDFQDFMLAQRKHGGKAVEDVVAAAREEGRPFTRLIYSLLVPWAAHVAYNLQLPVLWIQPATLFGVYYYYFNNYFDGSLGSNQAIELPRLPSLEGSDLPSFMLTSSPNIYDFALPTLFENFQILDREAKRPTVLVNTFQELEDPSDTSFGRDLIEKSVDDYVEWLESQEKLSVIYVAFGSISEISKPQMEEIAKGLIKSQRPFLWVIRGAEKEEMLSCRVDLEKQGKIVGWCSQVEVLSHSSVGCFVTHCGWNSSLESIVLGVPTVLFPQWCDQATNAKLIQDYWKTGLRVVKPENGGVIEGDEIKRCLDIVMDGGQMRMEAKKWRELAKEAMNEDGFSMSTSESSQPSRAGGLGGNEEIRGLIEKIRETSRYLKKSPAAAQKFDTALDECNLKDKRQVAMDVPNRWNSTFELLETALPLREAFCRLERIDKNYLFNPSESEWEVATSIHKCLHTFYVATSRFSGSKYPTSNVFFPDICKIYLEMTEWEHSEYDFIRHMAGPMKIKFDKYWDKCCLVLAVAVVFDPRVRDTLKYLFFTYGGSRVPSAGDTTNASSSIINRSTEHPDYETWYDNEHDAVEALVVADDWIRPIPNKVPSATQTIGSQVESTQRL
ncbi:hypothetical protein BUALT_Bualt13G0080000 [Buddleja alternifolia]|uniref:anthocyanidin 3-O-glucoside 5-O-glucosyltransferase n=1 Tax=Buddleja alternifolia TaxID=168488 RepID=A0AAV6WMP8_9LAMI|nr:hypothetical protein BUALT_Bualt13G0080000 [Buddleja alternifolia]